MVDWFNTATYDSLYRLTAADYSTGEAYAYQYDPAGNRTAMTDTTGTTTYTYDDANHLTSVDGVTYTWDARGNLTHDGVYTYTYNAAGRMVQAESITTTVVYTYTADGLRVAQAVAGDVSTFVWDWATGVPEMLGDGNNLYLIGYDTLGWDDGDSWTFVLPDALGSVRQETDDVGTVTAIREWLPYGEEIGGMQNGLGFTGEWYDANVGLTYLRARWYDGTKGRFTSLDPIVPDFQNPQSINLYIYVLNNSLKYIDPSGMRPRPGSIYSCNCGFIDENHLDDNPGSTASQIIQFVEGATPGDQLYYSLPNGACMKGWCVQITDMTVQIKKDLTSREKQEVALGIFQALENASEEGWAQTLFGSRYSEEDLTSNLLGFYRALGGEYTRENIEEWCDFLDGPESAEIFAWYIRYMGPAKAKEWGVPRLLTCSGRIAGCGWMNDNCNNCPLDKYCSGERKFPTDKFSIEPEPEGEKWEFVDPPKSGIGRWQNGSSQK